MEKIDPAKAMMFTCSGLDRYNYAAYPIFTLHKSDTAMIEAYRKIVKELNIPCQEIDLPGPEEPEVGFVVAHDDSLKIDEYMAKNGLLETDLGIQHDAWFDVPYTTLIPDGITLPRECYIDIHEMLQKRTQWTDMMYEEESFLILNVPTGDIVRAVVNYKRKDYRISGDVTGWLHVTLLPDM